MSFIFVCRFERGAVYKFLCVLSQGWHSALRGGLPSRQMAIMDESEAQSLREENPLHVLLSL